MPRPLIPASLGLLPLALLVAGCSSPDDAGGTSLTLNSGGAEVRTPGFSGSIGGKDGGAVRIDVPGFKGELNLPKVDLDADNFALNGVHLYPGSSVDALDVRGNGEGVRVRFASPATPERVRDWFRERLNKAGFTLTADGADLVGKDEDGKPFRMQLTPDGGAGARGTIVIGT